MASEEGPLRGEHQSVANLERATRLRWAKRSLLACQPIAPTPEKGEAVGFGRKDFHRHHPGKEAKNGEQAGDTKKPA